jgi:hypothetical protein
MTEGGEGKKGSVRLKSQFPHLRTSAGSFSGTELGNPGKEMRAVFGSDKFGEGRIFPIRFEKKHPS